MSKRLYRSTTNKMLAGVCGGVAEYFDADPTVVRLITVLLGIATGPIAVIGYIIAAVIIPVKDQEEK